MFGYRTAQGTRPALSTPPGITLASAVVSALAAVPVFYVLLRASQSSPEIWARLWLGRIPELLAGTLGLAVAVTAVTVAVSALLSYLVVRTDLPGRETVHWLLAVPLAIPAYIGAFAYIALLGHNGLARVFLAKTTGIPLQEVALPSIYSFGGTVLVLSLFTFPYVYLLAAAALRSGGGDLEEAALSCGITRIRTFFRVTLPLLRPSLAAGGLLVFLYVLSDFGTVAMLRFPTFTSAIYLQLVGRYDRGTAAVLSAVLLAVALAVICLERRLRGGARYHRNPGGRGSPPPVPLGLWRLPALFFAGAVIVLSLGVPLGMLCFWSAAGIAGGVVTSDFFHYVRNSLLTAGSAATASVALGLPLVFLAARNNGRLGKALIRMVYAGYALPGVIVALGLVFSVSSLLPALYGSVVLLVTACVVRFMPQAVQAEEAAMAQVHPCLEEAARLAGYSPWPAFLKVTLPLIRPGLISGWALVFISSAKELPATLILRPAGFDTLSVRVWIEASEGFFERGAPAALLLVLSSALPLNFLFRKELRKGGLDSVPD
jgi:iron(III) transport system permease protein